MVLGDLFLLLVGPVRDLIWILILLRLFTFLLCVRRVIWCVPVSAPVDLVGVLLIILVVFSWQLWSVSFSSLRSCISAVVCSMRLWSDLSFVLSRLLRRLLMGEFFVLLNPSRPCLSAAVGSSLVVSCSLSFVSFPLKSWHLNFVVSLCCI